MVWGFGEVAVKWFERKWFGKVEREREVWEEGVLERRGEVFFWRGLGCRINPL